MFLIPRASIHRFTETLLQFGKVNHTVASLQLKVHAYQVTKLTKRCRMSARHAELVISFHRIVERGREYMSVILSVPNSFKFPCV